jgi:hypothetical protein
MFWFGSWTFDSRISAIRSGSTPAIADQREIPHRVDARSLIAGAGNGFETVDGGSALQHVARGDVDLDAGNTDRQIVRIDRGREQVVKPPFQGQLSAPAIHARGDLLVGAPIVVDRSFQQQLGLALRRHGVEQLDLVLGEDVGRRRSWAVLQANQARHRSPRSAERT